MKIIDRAKFDRIVRHARQTNPFYRDFIPQGGPVPLLTRVMLQENNDLILNGHPVAGRTSGSTGSPVRIASTPARTQMENEDTALFVSWMGGLLPRTDITHPRVSGDSDMLVPVLTPVAEQIAILRDNHRTRGACAIITYPSNAVLLSEAILAENLDFSFILRLGLISEAIDPGQTALFCRAFPRAVQWSSYSAMEVGAIAFQCPHEPAFHHVMSHKLAVEILEEKGTDCEPGQIGRVVLTDYYNMAMPFIRYVIGDLAAFGLCPCGRIPQPALRDILGKVRGCLRRRDGRLVPFTSLSVALRDLPGMVQYQVVQEQLDHFVAKVASTRPLEAEIVAAFEAEFGYRPSIEVVPVSSIPRDPNGKFYASICRA
ncbi:MAG: hypothetical protein JHC85_11760 [Chthoniobacterales bacterium]|nr:hypothetical protein [Chthoniobacterales bacterium]